MDKGKKREFGARVWMEVFFRIARYYPAGEGGIVMLRGGRPFVTKEDVERNRSRVAFAAEREYYGRSG